MNEMKDRNRKPSDTAQLLQRGKSAWLLFGKAVIPTNLHWRSEVSCHTLWLLERINKHLFPSVQKYWVTGTGVKRRIRFNFLIQ